MSVAKVNRQKSRVERKCEKGGEVIAAGDEYLWFSVGFRAKYKHIRCLNHYPTMSERESSTLSEVYSAQEEFERGLDDAESAEEVQAAYDELASAIQSYAEERRQAAEAWEHGNSQLEEVADEWEDKASRLDGSFTVEDAPEDATPEELENWLETQRDAAREAAEEVDA